MFKLLIRPGLYQIPLPGVKAYLLDGGDDGVILVDTGRPGCADKILGSVHMHGWGIEDIRHILVTHLHPDHTGSLAELKHRTGARVYMHHSDASLIRSGVATRRLVPAPGLVNRVMARAAPTRDTGRVDAVVTDVHVNDRDVLPLAGGIEVVHTPGHSEGHVVYLARDQDTAFIGDAAATLFGLREMFVYEHYRQGLMSLAKIARLDFSVACFGHGEPITTRAAAAFRRKWGGRVR